MFNIYKNKSINNYPEGFIAILGITFWFFLAFPFANHNESYRWLAIFNNSSFYNILTEKMAAVATFRPLGQIVAYLSYKLTGGSIYLVQIFNYIVAIAAWFFIAIQIKDKKLFSIACLFVGGAFFSGYIYLFHLHGVFYSPLLLQISLLFYFFEFTGKYSDYKVSGSFLLTILISFFHPFAFPILIAYLTGIFLERLRVNAPKQHMLFIVIILISFLFVLIGGSGNREITGKNLNSLVCTYNLVEAHSLISLLSFALCIITLISIDKFNKTQKLILSLVTTVMTIFFWQNHLPILLLWIFVSLLKTIVLKKWSFVLLLLCTSILPIIGSGSPTYSIFTIIICTVILAYKSDNLECKIIQLKKRYVLIAYVFCFVLILLLRAGVHLPVVSSLTKPILAEKEKTFQLESLISWVLNSEYKNCALLLSYDKSNPVDAGDVNIKRKHLPPTFQNYLDIYMNSKRNYLIDTAFNNAKLYITFGDDKKGKMTLLKTIDGKFAGKAIIFK